MTSRWLSADPIFNKYLDKIQNNKEIDQYNFALYTYAKNNPLKFVDPAGLFDVLPIMKDKNNTWYYSDDSYLTNVPCPDRYTDPTSSKNMNTKIYEFNVNDSEKLKIQLWKGNYWYFPTAPVGGEVGIYNEKNNMPATKYEAEISYTLSAANGKELFTRDSAWGTHKGDKDPYTWWLNGWKKDSEKVNSEELTLTATIKFNDKKVNKAFLDYMKGLKNQEGITYNKDSSVTIKYSGKEKIEYAK